VIKNRFSISHFSFVIRGFNLEVQLGNIDIAKSVAVLFSFTPGFSQVIYAPNQPGNRLNGFPFQGN
jgi:hypothetical protein